MPFGIPADQVVDAEYTTVDGAAPTVSRYVAQRPGVININDGQMTLTPPTPSELAVIEKQARAISVFIRVPFFAYCAISGKVPTLLRLTAAVLGVLEVAQLARDNGYDYQNLEQW